MHLSNGHIKIPGAAGIRHWNMALIFSRQKKNLSRDQLAAQIRIGVTDIDLWESGHGAPSEKVLGRLYAVLPLLPRFKHLLPNLAVKAATDAERFRNHPRLTPSAPPKAPEPPVAPTAPAPPKAEAPPPKAPEPEPPLAAQPAAPPPAPFVPPLSAKSMAATKPLAAGTFGAALRQARERRGLLQESAAKYLGFNQSRLSSYERESIVSPPMLARLVAAFPELGEPGVPPPKKGKTQRSEAMSLPMPRPYPLPAGIPPAAPVPPSPGPEAAAVSVPAAPRIDPPAPAREAKEPAPLAPQPAPTPVVVVAKALPPIVPEVLRPETPIEELAVTMARAMIEAKDATKAYEEAMAAAVAAEERKKKAVARADSLLAEMRERTGWAVP